METIFDLFDEHFEYPSNEIAEHGGLPECTLYSYVSSTFLNGFINYVDIIKAFVVERYCNEWDEVIPQQVKEFHQSYHSSLRKIHDDKWILAQGDRDYWLFIFDEDVSDCSIGRIDKSKVSLAQITKLFDSITSNNEQYCKGKKAELKFSGWVSG